MMKVGSVNRHGQKLVGKVGVSDEDFARLAESANTVRDDSKGFCIVRTRDGLPDLVLHHAEWSGSREEAYSHVSRDLRSWVLSFNSAKDVKWLKNVGYLANDLKLRAETKMQPELYRECSVDDADGALVSSYGFFVREIRDSI